PAWVPLDSPSLESRSHVRHLGPQRRDSQRSSGDFELPLTEVSHRVAEPGLVVGVGKIPPIMGAATLLAQERRASNRDHRRQHVLNLKALNPLAIVAARLRLAEEPRQRVLSQLIEL